MALKISKIHKSFNNEPVLTNINLHINPIEIFGFIGLNGVGKTTLIKIILDLLSQDSGEVKIFGIDNFLPESRKKLFYLPEKFQPSPHLKGEEFLNFALSFYNVKPSKEDIAKICANLDFDFNNLKKTVSQYSKGMIQKLGLISLFLSKADLVILDEPMSGLDLKARINLKRELLEYKKLGKAIFFSSHILADMDEICDKIAILHNKQIAFEGLPSTLKHQYNSNNLDEAFLQLLNKVA